MTLGLTTLSLGSRCWRKAWTPSAFALCHAGPAQTQYTVMFRTVWRYSWLSLRNGETSLHAIPVCCLLLCNQQPEAIFCQSELWGRWDWLSWAVSAPWCLECSDLNLREENFISCFACSSNLAPVKMKRRKPSLSS